MSYQPPSIPDITLESVLDALNAIKETIEVREGRRGSDSANQVYLTLERLVSALLVVRTLSANTVLADTVAAATIRPGNGITGWFDDGTNFRVTVTNGIITGIAASTAAGFSVS